MLETLKELCSLPGISGREDKVRDYIISRIEGFCDYKIDPLGNLIVFKNGKNSPKNKIMLDSHMDEVGMIVTGADSGGFLKFATVGGVDPEVIIGRTVLIGEKNIPGVLGIKPIHLIEKSEEQDLPKKDDMYIDIGADSLEEALAVVNYGDSVHFLSEFIENGNTVNVKAIDDRFGCYVLIELIKSELEYDMDFAFVVQEEVGLRGSKAATYTLDPEFALVIETTTSAQIPEIDAHKQVCTIGGGAVISVMDRRTIYDKELVNLAFDIAGKNGINAQYKRAVAGGNDAGSIHKSRAGVRTITVNVPCRYIHSASCVCDKNDLLAARRLAEKIGEAFATA